MVEAACPWAVGVTGLPPVTGMPPRLGPTGEGAVAKLSGRVGGVEGEG